MTESGADLDVAALESYLSDALGVAVTRTEVLSDKLNLVVAVSTADGEYVVRRPTELRDTALFVGLREEYEVLRRLQGTAVPTPEPVLFCGDASVLGESFFVTTRLDGEPVARGTDLPERFRTPDARRQLTEAFVEALAAVHSLPVEPFEQVCERQGPLEQVRRATDRLDAAERVTGYEVPQLRAVADWLRENPPSRSRTTLVHGDFRPGNVLFAGTDEPRIAGVIDWETTMLGDPLTELGYVLLDWRDDGDPTLSLDDLEAAYGGDERYRDALATVRRMNVEGLAPFTADPGSLDRREVLARYEAATGTAFENEREERFYRAHAAFVLAAVWQELDRHAVATGGTASRQPYVAYMAMVADGLAHGELT